MEYVDLQVTTNFSFLQGGSHPEEMVKRAVALGYKAIAVTDRNTLAGIVRAHLAAKAENIRFIPACRLDLMDGPALLAYPTDRAAYSKLSAMLTKGNLRSEKGKCTLYRRDVYEHASGIRFIVLPPEELDAHFDFAPAFVGALEEYKTRLGKALYLGARITYNGQDQKRLFRLGQLEARLGTPVIALNDVLYHTADRRELQDVLTCIRERCTVQEAGYRLQANAERYLKSISEMHRLFRTYPQAIENALQLAQACTFSLDELNYQYPEEITTGGRSPMEELIRLSWDGAVSRFGDPIPEKIKATLEMELAFIARKAYASYFLTVYDLVRFAREKKILCQGRGSAANSVVCYCLGITAVDPSQFKLLFARFMSDARDEPPDIDVDFEHERREEVMQYVYEKYGRHRAGVVATVTQVHWKGAVRDVGKAMGLSIDLVNRLSKSDYEFTSEWLAGKSPPTSAGFDSKDPHLRKVLELTHAYMGFPRQLGQHTGGFVITRDNLTDLCPVMNARMEGRTNIEWNKDDIEALGFMKVDILALGMLTCIRKAFDLIKQHYNRDLSLAAIPQKDSKVYAMISLADTLGVFQIESRAQMAMLPRLRPRTFYDLVIEVALVRPGPIQGDMVHPYLRRRNQEEPEEYPSEALKAILKRTLGVPLFQEQAMEIAIVAAGFSPDQADGLRRSMATFKAKGKVSAYEKMLIEGMIKNGYAEDFAKRVFRQLEGFGSYGFPESHAVSFALLVYVSSWIKCYYPDVFAAALLNSQPMGFYRPAQLVIDARKHGVQVRPVDVNFSSWDNTLEEKSGNYAALRLGFRQVKGVKEEDIQLLCAGRVTPFTSLNELFQTGISRAGLERLADADAFGSIGLDRRQALWEVAALSDHPVGVFEGLPSESKEEAAVRLPALSLMEHVVQDYASTTLSLKAHPVSFARRQLDSWSVTPTANLEKLKQGMPVRVAGLITVRQRPGTAKGVVFITIEDETGCANLVVWKTIFEKYRKEILQSRLLLVSGHLQVEGKVIHVVVHTCHNRNALLQPEHIMPQQAASARMDNPPGHRDIQLESKAGVASSKWVQGELFPSRDFK